MTAEQTAAEHGVGISPSVADEGLNDLAKARAHLESDIQTLLLPDPSQGYKSGVVSAEADALERAVHNPQLDGYIRQASSSLQHSLNGLFGKPGDGNSLRTQIQDGNWTAAQHTEAAEIAAAGKGISNLAQRQMAMMAFVGQLVKYGPANAQYRASLDQAFDAAAVRPMVSQLNALYANPVSQVPPNSTNVAALASRAGAFAQAFRQDMQGSTPQVRMALIEDLLGESHSPLLAAAAEIRAASNNSILAPTTPGLVYDNRMKAVSAAAPLPPGLAPPSGAAAPKPRSLFPASIWDLSSTAEIDSAYRDLAAATDLAAIGDTTGTGTGLIHQVAAAILGNPNAPGHANLTVLYSGMRQAAAQGNINLSNEIAGLLQTSGNKSAAATALSYTAKGVSQFEAQVGQDIINLTRLPQSLQIPVGSMAGLFSNPATAKAALAKYLAAHPNVAQQVRTKMQADLAALELDGQGVVRVNYAIQDMLPTLQGSKGAWSLTVAGDNLVNDPNSLLAITASPDAQGELAYRANLTAYVNQAGQQPTPWAKGAPLPGNAASNPGWTKPHGFASFPAGILWVGRDITTMFATTTAKGRTPFSAALSFPKSPFNRISSLGLDLTGTVALQINNLAQDEFGGGGPINIDAIQTRISQLKDRTLTLQFGPWKVSNSGMTGQIGTLTDMLKSDPSYQTLQSLQGRLALASNPTQRLALMTQISDIEAASVNRQLDWMTRQAAGDNTLLTRISNLRQSYMAAQQRMQGIDLAIVESQTAPTAANVLAWVNQAGKFAGKGRGALPATPEGEALSLQLAQLPPETRAALLSGKYAGTIEALPESLLTTLQQYIVAEKGLGGPGPKAGLLPTAEGGLAFSGLKLFQMAGGAAYLSYLGLQPGGSWLNTAFGFTLATFSAAPSFWEFSSGALQRAAGSNLSKFPLLGDWLDSGATLFTRGASTETVAKAFGSLASWAWLPLMGIWSAQEFAGGDPVQGAASGAMGLSYLLPELFADSAWAGPASAVIDLIGVSVVVGDTLWTTEEKINQYNGQIQSLLEQAGVKADVAYSLSRPDSQGIAAVIRMSQVFDSLQYYSDPNKPQQNDQRRIAFLNSLTPEQAAVLREALLNMPVSKSGQVSKTGALNIVIPPPPTTLTPAAVKQYYETALTARGLPLPPDPSTFEGYRVPPQNYATYYGMWTEDLAQTGQPGFQWFQPQNLTNPGTYVKHLPGWNALLPNNIQEFLYYAAAMGCPLQGSFNQNTG